MGTSRPLGGIGRRAGFRSQCPSGRGGSRPLAGTGNGAGERHPSGREREAGFGTLPASQGRGRKVRAWSNALPASLRALLTATQTRLAERQTRYLEVVVPHMWASGFKSRNGYEHRPCDCTMCPVSADRNCWPLTRRERVPYTGGDSVGTPLSDDAERADRAFPAKQGTGILARSHW